MSDTHAPTAITYTITAEDPATGRSVIRAQLSAEDAAAEVDCLRAKGMENIKVTPTSDPAGSAG